MIRKFLTYMSLAAILCLACESVKAEYNWEVGAQNNYPLWGGLSVKYLGLRKIQFQFVERYWQRGQRYDAMLGIGIPFVILNLPWNNFYVAPGGGLRLNQHIIEVYRPQDPNQPISEYDMIRRIVKERHTGGWVLFGTEFIIKSRFGLNVEFGQGYFRVKRSSRCEDEAGSKIDCKSVNELSWSLSDEKDGVENRANFVIGCGFHIYF